MDISRVVDHFGGLQRTAEAIGCSKQRIAHWVNSGKIPLIQQCHIEHVTQGEFVADTSHLPFELVVQ